jgi:putative addiction module killer protein
VFRIQKTPTFNRWFARLRDRLAQRRIQGRIDRMEDGNLGDWKPVGGGVSEARLDFGPGYRLYFIRRGSTIIVLLCGGDKSTQRRDIAQAIALAAEIEGN